MAGVKGRSGGKRVNAGRKAGPKPEQAVKAQVDAARAADVARQDAPAVDAVADPVLRADGSVRKIGDGPRDPLEFLKDALNDPTAPFKDRIRAAIAAAQYVHTKTHDGGKKDAVAEKAKKAAGGKFAQAAPPRLVVSNK